MIITKELIISSFVSKVISDCGDILKSKIRDAVENRKFKEQTMETRIYQVIIDVLNGFSYNNYKKEEKVYDAAELILKRFKSGMDDYKEAVRAGLKVVVPQVTGSICEEFLGELCLEICREENRDLAVGCIIHQGDQLLDQQKQTDQCIREGFERSRQHEMEINRKLDELLTEIIGMKEQETEAEKEFVINRADEYAQKWEENVFLNNFNEEDEYKGTEIKLGEIYKENCLPHYIWKQNSRSSDSLKNLLKKYLTEYDSRKMLLILGQPGIGKSTLITWILANLMKKKDDVLVYQFAADLDGIDWRSKDTLNDIFKITGMGYDELENKTLILDGFDESYVGSDRERILNKLYQELKRKNKLKIFSLIITCRENYIYHLQNIECDYITLQAWDETQIESFCKTYWKKCGKEISEDKIKNILQSKEIFGIPLILYMILALDITIERSSSIVDVYDQIFSLEKGGIYDRCYDTEHRINEPEIKKYIHQASQKIAFWIFEHNHQKAFIYQKNFKEICEAVMGEAADKNKDIQSDTLIGGYFKIRHCEGKMADEVNFVHRSIYEYFVALYFFESINELSSKERIAGKLGELLADGVLSDQILKFVKIKFDCMRQDNLSGITKEVFQIMLQDGMIFHTGMCYRYAIEREMNIFSNMLKIVQLWNPVLGKLNERISVYLRHNEQKLNLAGIVLGNIDLSRAYLGEADLNGAHLNGADLEGADLNGAKLNGAHLFGTKLSGANLSNANLREAYLNGANLAQADLSKADLNGANLRGTYFKGADLNSVDLRGVKLFETNLDGAGLEGTVFDEGQVDLLSKKYDLSGSNVYLAETDEIISYQEYCLAPGRDKRILDK